MFPRCGLQEELNQTVSGCLWKHTELTEYHRFLSLITRIQRKLTLRSLGSLFLVSEPGSASILLQISWKIAVKAVGGPVRKMGFEWDLGTTEPDPKPRAGSRPVLSEFGTMTDTIHSCHGHFIKEPLDIWDS